MTVMCCARQEADQTCMHVQLRLSDATALRRAEAAVGEAETMTAEAVAQVQQAALQMRAEVERAISAIRQTLTLYEYL